MKLTEFEIGRDFNMSEHRYRCTDKGSRVIVAMQIDQVDVGGSNPRTLDYEAANAEGWFNGPPYAGLEIVIDEDSMVVCWDDEHPIESEPERSWRKRRDRVPCSP